MVEDSYYDVFVQAFYGYANYLWQEILHPSWNNYFYVLLGLSFLVWALEIIFPWRKGQSIFRKDFWLDLFYMFFNFFIFSLIGYNALSFVGVEVFHDFLSLLGLNNLVAIEVSSWPVGWQWFTLFLIVDFIQWGIHILLHRWSFLWSFHQLHHSVKEMGFAAHFRFHWMEVVIYKTLQYIPVAMIGFGIQDFFVVHAFTILMGHLNHSNLGWDYGWLKYIFNNPKMHIWHHAKEMPNHHPYGMNFGQTLSIWDYLFGTAYVPKEGRDIELGFSGDENYPQNIKGQWLAPFQRKKSDR